MKRDDPELSPYRVEWRTNLVTNWQLISDQSKHEAALEAAGEAIKKWGGQARVVSQHVIALYPAAHQVARHESEL